jgi:hypothetical protein
MHTHDREIKMGAAKKCEKYFKNKRREENSTNSLFSLLFRLFLSSISSPASTQPLEKTPHNTVSLPLFQTLTHTHTRTP